MVMIEGQWMVSAGRLGQVWGRAWVNEATLSEELQAFVSSVAPDVVDVNVLSDTCRTVDLAVVSIAVRYKRCGAHSTGEVSQRLRRRLLALRASWSQPKAQLGCLVSAVATMRAEFANLVDLFEEWRLDDEQRFAAELLADHERVSWALQDLVRASVLPRGR